MRNLRQEEKGNYLLTIGHAGAPAPAERRYSHMKREVRDGWHAIQGYDVYVEDGIIKRGTLGEGTTNYRPAYPYRHSKQYDCWIIENNLTISAFAAGVRRGTIAMF